MQIALMPRIADDLDGFLKALTAEESYSPKELGIDLPLTAIVDRVRRAYAVPAA
jgi:hypothetical protein